MPRTAHALPIPPQELLGMQAQLPPHGSTLWQGDAGAVMVARIPGQDPDLVNDLERIAEWASAADVLKAEACIMLTARKVHTLPMAPIRSHVEQRIAMDRRQAKLLRQQLPPGLSFKLYRAVDDPYRRVRLGVRFPEDRMRDVDDGRLDELAAHLGAMLDGGFDDVHCVHLVSATDDVRLAPDAFLADLLPRWKDERRRAEAQRRLDARRRQDAVARGAEGDALRSHLAGAGTAPIRRATDRHSVDWDPELESNQEMASIHAHIDAIGGDDTRDAGGPDGATKGALSMLRRRLRDHGYALRLHPSVPGHAVHLAADRPDQPPERLLAWAVPVLDQDTAERALAATRDLHADLGVVVAPEADEEAQRVLVATRVRWVTPDRIEGLRL